MNLLPLSRSRNSHLSNARFSVKRGDDGVKNGYGTGCFSELEVALQDDWTPQSIVDRGLRVVKFIESRWGVSFGTLEQRLLFLGLEFISFPLAEHETASSGTLLLSEGPINPSSKTTAVLSAGLPVAETQTDNAQAIRL